MNRGRSPHPDEESLLQYVDGELASRDAARVREHLEACWSCRAEVEDIQGTITDYARYHGALSTSPEPPRPWNGFELRLERLAAQRQNSWGKRARHILRGITPPRQVWASAVAAMLLVGVAIAVNGVFRFWDDEPVEITAKPDQPALSTPAEPANVAPQPLARPAPPPDRGSHPAISEPAQELHAVAALRSVGADLGEQIELSRDNSRRLVIAGTAVRPERQELLRSVLADVPGVVLRFHEPSPVLASEAHPPAETGSSSSTGGTPNAAIRLQLEQALGGTHALERFANEVLETSAEASARAHALRKLADRFSPDVEVRLGDEDQALLRRLREDHIRALARHVGELERLAGPILLSLGASADQVEVPLERREWQQETQDLFAAVQRLDRLLTTLVTGAGAGPPEIVIGEAYRALTRLSAEIGRYPSVPGDVGKEER